MSQAVLMRQLIRDSAGQPIAVILPIEEYALIRPILDNRDQALADKMFAMELVANDALFLADLHETMAAFEVTDSEWWEHAA